MSKLGFSSACGVDLKKKAFFILVFAFLGARIFAQQSGWVDSFDKIHDPDTLQKLHSYQKQGWESVFRATGESAAAFTDEAQLEIQQLRTIIASDDDAIMRSKSIPVAAPTPEQCKPALTNPRDPLFAVCDKSLRQDQLQAISGILQLLPAYEASLPKPEVEGHYGKNLSSEVVATLRIRVLSPEPVPANMISAMGPGSSVLLTSFADDGRTLEVHQGDNVVVELVANGKRVPGFVVDPIGILVPKPGVVRVDTNRKIFFRAAKPGLATIAFHGPLAQGNTNDLFPWSGYVNNTGGPFWGVAGQWQVPAVARSCGVASTWVGMNDHILLQVGTREEYSLGILGIGGGFMYVAWWEAYPINEEQDIGKSVNPGDWILAAVTPTPLPFAPMARMTITNISQGWTFSTDYPLGGAMPKPQAEWILEDPEPDFFTRPCWPSSAQTLAEYGQVTFDYGNAFATSLNDLNEPIWVPAGFTAKEQTAFNINNQVSTPGPPSCDGNGFFLTYSGPSVPPVSNQFASPGPVVNTALLGPAQLDSPYSQILVASDPWAPFQGPWSWALASGNLPPGMSLDSSGVINGKSLANGTYAFSVVATNNANFAHASSCPQELSINVSLTALSSLQIQCGGVSPSSPAATIAVNVDGTPAACGTTLNLPPGPHTVVGSVQNGTATTGYKMLYGGACKQNGIPPPLSNPPAVVQLAQGQVQFCGVGAESWQLVESAGCRTDQKCCEGSPTGCKRCVKSSEACP